MRLTRAKIAGLIPHAGAMCLLDGVVQWDANRISCVSRSYRDAERVIYQFTLRVGEVEVMSGRTTVVLNSAGVAGT